MTSIKLEIVLKMSRIFSGLLKVNKPEKLFSTLFVIYRNCVYCSYLVRFNTDKIDIGFYHALSDLFTLDCTVHNTHNYVIFQS